MELTDKQKEEAKEIIDKLINFWWQKVLDKVEAGMSYEVAIAELHEEILNE